MLKAVTPWFPGDVKPVRPGVYERDVACHITCSWSFWTGEQWMLPGRNAEEASRHHGQESMVQNRAWRGLAAAPELKG